MRRDARPHWIPDRCTLATFHCSRGALSDT